MPKTAEVAPEFLTKDQVKALQGRVVLRLWEDKRVAEFARRSSLVLPDQVKRGIECTIAEVVHVGPGRPAPCTSTVRAARKIVENALDPAKFNASWLGADALLRKILAALDQPDVTPIPVKKDDLVFCLRYGGRTLEIEGAEYRVMEDWEILAVIERS